MRVPSTSLAHSAMMNMQRAATELGRAHERVTSGRRIQQASDDPAAAAQVLSLTGELRAGEQYMRNVETARARVAHEEAVLDQVTTILDRAKELGLSQGSATATAATRENARAEVDQLLSTLVNLANTQFEGHYLFAGDQGLSAPITGTTPPYTAGPSASQSMMEIGTGELMAPVRTAEEMFVTTGALDCLRDLSAMFAANDMAGIRACLNQIDDSHAAMQVCLAENGVCASTIEVAAERLTSSQSAMNERRANLEEADMEQAFSELSARQTTYQAALLATSRVINLSLVDYLR